MKKFLPTLLLLLCFFFFPATTHADTTTGLVGWWTLDGRDTNWATGQTQDKSGSGNTGQLIVMSTSTSPVLGKLGQALKFNGNAYIDTGVSSAAFNFSGNVSGSAWIKTSTDGRLILFWQNGNPLIYMEVGATTAGGTAHKFVTYLRTNGGTVQVSSSLSSVDDNKWHHVVFTRNTSDQKLRLYVDGQLETTDDYTDVTAIDTSGGAHWIGGSSGTYPFNGTIDDVRIYNRALTATDVAQLYRAGATKLGASPTQSLTTGLVGHWTLDGRDTNWATGQTLDRSGNSNTGQLISMSTTTSPTLGKLGQALYFASSTLQEEINMTSLATTATNNYTMAAWIYPAQLNTMTRIAVQNGSDNGLAGDGYGFGIGGYSGGVGSRLTAVNSGVAWIDTGYAFPSAKRWYHIVMERDQGTTKFFVNGVQTASTSASTPTTPTTVTHIGGQTAFRPWLGSIDDVRVYNRALSATEINQLYKMGTATVGASPTQTLTDGLVGYWTFDGKDTNWTAPTTGTTRDRSTNNITGTLTNMNVRTTPVLGKIGQGLAIASSTYVDLGTSAALEPTSRLSVSAWVKRTRPLGNYEGIFSSRKTAGNNTGYILIGYTGNMIRFYLWNGAWVYAESNTSIPLNQWQLVTGTWDGSTVRLYINGVLQTTTGSTGSIVYGGTATNHFIGRYVSYSDEKDYWPGVIDEVRVYNRALSAAEINQLYKIGSATSR